MHGRPTHEYRSRYYSNACMDLWIFTKYPIVRETLAGSNLYGPTRPISLDTFVLSYIQSFLSRTVHSQESRIFEYEAPLAAKNENMATRSEPAVEREWM